MDISALTEMIRRSLNVIEEDMTDDEVREYIEDFVFSSRHVSMQSLGAIDRMIDSVYYSLRSDLGILQPYIDDKSVNEIMVNGKDDI